MRYILVVSLILLSACTIQVTDKRLPREEVAEAFAQRDKALQGLTEVLKKHQERLDDIKPVKK